MNTPKQLRNGIDRLTYHILAALDAHDRELSLVYLVSLVTSNAREEGNSYTCEEVRVRVSSLGYSLYALINVRFDNSCVFVSLSSYGIKALASHYKSIA